MSQSTEDLLNASRSPSIAPDTSGRRPGVRRLNNIPIYIVGGVVLGFALLIALVAATKGQQSAGQATQGDGKDATRMADSLLNELPQEGGLITAKASEPAMPALPDGMASAPDLPASAPTSLPMVPDMANLPATPPEVDQEAEQIRQAKAQMFQAALAAPTKVDVVASTSRGSSGLYTAALSSSGSGTPNRSEMLAQIAEVQRMSENAGSNPAEVERVYNQQLANAQQMAAAGGQDGVQGAGGMPGLNTPPTPGNIPRQTAQNGGNNWRLESQVERPNAYMIRSGAVIPATLISGINSDLPGMVQAQISQNVYDTATGRHLLLPQGSRLVGTYSSGINLGQRRLFIAWNRIVFPDGKALDIGDMPGASGAGYAGFSDRINNHYGRLWGNALMLSLVGASITYSVDKNSNNNNSGNNNNGNNSTVRGALSESLGQTFGQAVSQSIQKNMNVSPTLEIRPGYRFNVIITKDIDFSKPYRSFDY